MLAIKALGPALTQWPESDRQQAGSYSGHGSQRGHSLHAFRRRELARDQGLGPALAQWPNTDRQQAGSYRGHGDQRRYSQLAFRRSELARDQGLGTALTQWPASDRQQAGSYRGHGDQRRYSLLAFRRSELARDQSLGRHWRNGRIRIASKLAPTEAMAISAGNHCTLIVERARSRSESRPALTQWPNTDRQHAGSYRGHADRCGHSLHAFRRSELARDQGLGRNWRKAGVGSPASWLLQTQRRLSWAFSARFSFGCATPRGPRRIALFFWSMP